MPIDELKNAARAVGQCAKHADAKAPTRSPVSAAEIQVGLGTCSDGLAWASRLRALDFSTSVKRNSDRADSHLEATRFTYTWSAANAIFSRDELLRLLGSNKVPKSELDRFRLMADAAALSPAQLTQLLHPLHATLQVPRTPQSFPWSKQSSMRVIDLIYHKYTPAFYQSRGSTAKKIGRIVRSGSPVSALDLPEVLYSARNWLMHGALLDSSFRGSSKQFTLFARTLTKATAIILERSSHVIHAAL